MFPLIRNVLLVSLFALIAIIGSTNGQTGCDSSYSRADMYDEQSRAYAESSDRMNRITLDCQTSGGVSGGNGGSTTIIEISVGLFFLIWVAIGIWVICVCRQKAMNAAAVTPHLGDMGAKEMSNGMNENKTVAMGTPIGKPINGDNNV